MRSIDAWTISRAVRAAPGRTDCSTVRIGLEVSSLAVPYPTGIARYMRSLALALAEAYPDDRFSLWYRLSRLKHRELWWRPDGFRTRVWQDGWWPPVTGLDLFHGLDGAVPGRRLPTVATLHDLTVFLHRDADAASDGFRQRKLDRYREMTRHADRVIAVSESTRRDAIELLGLPPERLRVVPHGVERRFSRATRDREVERRYGLRSGYLIYVGAVSQRKNTERLVRAFALSTAARGRQLLLAGRLWHRSEPTRRAIRELGIEHRVVLADHVRDRHLPALYAGAAALAFPTLYEGFGLPILEAMAAGTPVLCGNRGAAPETAGPHAVTVNPEDTQDIAGGIDRVLLSPPATGEPLRRHAADFTWQRSAVQTGAIYREILDDA